MIVTNRRRYKYYYCITASPGWSNPLVWSNLNNNIIFGHELSWLNNLFIWVYVYTVDLVYAFLSCLCCSSKLFWGIFIYWCCVCINMVSKDYEKAGWLSPRSMWLIPWHKRRAGRYTQCKVVYRLVKTFDILHGHLPCKFLSFIYFMGGTFPACLHNIVWVCFVVNAPSVFARSYRFRPVCRDVIMLYKQLVILERCLRRDCSHIHTCSLNTVLAVSLAYMKVYYYLLTY